MFGGEAEGAKATTEPSDPACFLLLVPIAHYPLPIAHCTSATPFRQAPHSASQALASRATDFEDVPELRVASPMMMALSAAGAVIGAETRHDLVDGGQEARVRGVSFGNSVLLLRWPRISLNLRGLTDLSDNNACGFMRYATTVWQSDHRSTMIGRSSSSLRALAARFSGPDLHKKAILQVSCLSSQRS